MVPDRFTNKKVLTGYIRHKTGKGHNDFSEPYPIELEPSNSIRWQKKVVVLIDDVLNTGRVLTYAMKPLLSTQVSRIEVAVLVNRSHPQFPIQPTYTGYALSTTLSDHVEVNLSKKPAVYLH